MQITNCRDCTAECNERTACCYAATVKVTWRNTGAFAVPLLQWKINYITYSVCVCSLSYPACKAHTSYCIVICGLSLPYYCSLQLVFQKFLIVRRIQRHNIINVHRYLLFLSDFKRSWISSTNLREKLYCTFLSKSVQCEPCRSTWPDEWTWRSEPVYKRVVSTHAAIDTHIPNLNRWRKWWALRPPCPWRRNHWIGGCVGNKVSLHVVEKRKICCSCRDSDFGLSSP